MERSIPTQIFDTLHLMLRVILGIVMTYVAVATAGFITLFLVISIGLSSKYGPVYEEDVFWPMIFLLAGTIPSLLGALVLIFKNRLASRNPRETAFAAINVLPVFITMKLFSGGNDATSALMLTAAFVIALIYAASAVGVIVVAWTGRQHTSVSSGSHLLK